MIGFFLSYNSNFSLVLQNEWKREEHVKICHFLKLQKSEQTLKFMNFKLLRI